MYRSVKTKRTLFTEEKIANLNKNIEKFDWAKERADKIVAKADAFLEMGIERFVVMFPPQELARSFDVNQEHGCPNCGLEMMHYTNWGWLYDHINHPWKVICPHCGKMYPSNDFGAFYESGLDEHGIFSYDRADRSLLVNELYPEMGPDYAVDDGSGWLTDESDPQTCRYTFIAHYIGDGIWANDWDKISDWNKMSEQAILGVVKTLSLAYLITNDRKYAYPAAMCYYRIALLYPTLDVSAYPWKDGYKQTHGHTGMGRFCGCINDTFMMKDMVEWYDMLYDAIDDGLAAYLREKPVRYIGEVPMSGKQIRDEIEEKMLMQVYPDLRSYVLHCNPGPPQALILKTAKILDRQDLFDECAEFIMTYIDRVRSAQHYFDLDSLFLGEIDRDGFGGEVSSGYNGMWVEGFMEAALLLRGHKYDLFDNPKFRKLGNMAVNYVAADRYGLAIADADKCGNPDIYLLRNPQINFFLATGRTEDAQLLVQEYGDGPICTDWFMDCAAVDRLIRETAEKAGPFRSKSRCFPGYGLAMFESHPDGKDPETMGVFFGRNTGHGHRDTLNLFVHGFGIDLMPDHGYPNFADPNPERFRWTSNYLSHNTVTMLQKEPFEPIPGNLRLGDSVAAYDLGGKIHHYYTDGAVSVVDVDAAHMYDHERVDFIKDECRRTVVNVDLDGKSRYIVDLFACGAKDPYISFHAIGTETAVTGAEFVPQNGGTYAGTDVPYADRAYSGQWCNGFNYLTDVRRSVPEGAFTVDWTCVDNWHVWDRDRNVHLKLHMLSNVTEAALCTGMPPQAHPGNPKAMTYLIAKYEGPADMLTVLEPYEDASFIESCTHTRDGDTVTVTVTHKNGRVDIVAVVRNGDVCRVCVDSTTGYRMSYGDTVLTGEVVDFTKELSAENDITVRMNGEADAKALIGRFVDIETDVRPNAFYEIKGAKDLGNGLWKLDVGDCTLIAGYIDRMNKNLGYRYFVREGAKARIAM